MHCTGYHRIEKIQSRKLKVRVRVKITKLFWIELERGRGDNWFVKVIVKIWWQEQERSEPEHSFQASLWHGHIWLILLVCFHFDFDICIWFWLMFTFTSCHDHACLGVCSYKTRPRLGLGVLTTLPSYLGHPSLQHATLRLSDRLSNFTGLLLLVSIVTRIGGALLSPSSDILM